MMLFEFSMHLLIEMMETASAGQTTKASKGKSYRLLIVGLLIVSLGAISINQIHQDISHNYQLMLYSCSPQGIQALLGPFQPPKLQCNSKNQIKRFCSNQNCQYDAMCCDKHECQNCQKVHENCPTYRLDALNQRVEHRLSLNKRILKNVCDAQDDLINKLLNDRKAFIEKCKAWEYKGTHQETIDKIYVQHNTKGLKGKDLKKMFIQIEGKTAEEIQSEQQLQIYKAEAEKMLKVVEKLRNDIIQYYIDIQSKILANEKEKTLYLLKQLGNPKQVKLLFRASQHGFLASKFRQICNGAGNTVTIVSTEFGKTIAGYTPLEWRTVNKYVADTSMRSFLLQLELKQKMALIKPQYAIQNHTDSWGPVFGGQPHDLVIANNANKSTGNYSTFPSFYNCKGKQYEKNKESIKAFCGDPSGKFKVPEYQVLVVVQ